MREFRSRWHLKIAVWLLDHTPLRRYLERYVDYIEARNRQAIEVLFEQARYVKMTPEQKEAQRRSWAYGNTKIENDSITEETVDRAAEKEKA